MRYYLELWIAAPKPTPDLLLDTELPGDPPLQQRNATVRALLFDLMKQYRLPSVAKVIVKYYSSEDHTCVGGKVLEHVMLPSRKDLTEMS
ncbi:hypothetical protein KSF_108710 [Reticulibacter mediterranei]|uniref:Uncharacterized protein n=1 Tax=Reticulibacter mediterranei TaxID=2778369 RepID=A0A8J3N9I3_9CHLR|nr:hypothetical protein KSF_108710 [Reticulibacter mediterranei]